MRLLVALNVDSWPAIRLLGEQREGEVGEAERVQVTQWGRWV